MLTDEVVASWHKNLMTHDELQAFWLDRGCTLETLVELEIGWRADKGRYSIPVRDADGVLRDVKQYRTDADPKNIHTKGYGRPTRLFGAERVAKSDPTTTVWLCAGEPDAIRVSSLGLLGVSGTSGEGSLPRPEDLELLRDRHVVVIYDADDAGRKGAAKIVAALLPIAESVKNVTWPKRDGKDVTDWLAGRPSSWSGVARTKQGLIDLADLRLAETSLDRRPSIESLLEWAMDDVDETGSRNETGFRLACQLRDNRYPREEAHEVVGVQYRESVTGLKDEPYTVDEARASVDSAYDEAPRDPTPMPGSGSWSSVPRFDWNDAGNADLLLSLHGDDMRHVSEIGRGGTWNAWTGHGWAPGAAVVNDFALDVVKSLKAQAGELRATGDKAAIAAAGKLSMHAVQSGNDSRLRAMLHQASLRDGVTVPASKFDADPGLLPFRDRTLELRPDGHLAREHRREDYLRTLVDVDYDPGAVSERWEAFLDRFLPDPDLRAYVQKLVGYSLYGANTERLLVFLIGPSSTGKSTFIELLAKALGPGLASTFNLSLFKEKAQEGPRVDLLAAMTQRLIFTSEAGSSLPLHADAIKRMTGGDTLTARGMMKDVYVSMVPKFTPWIVTNVAPTIERADPALWRRIVAVPFTNVVPTDADEPNFRATFPASELAGVLAWAVRGWDMYCRDGLKDRPAAVVETTEALQRSLSTLDEFLYEECEIGKDYSVPSAELYGAYKDWWDRSGLAERDRLPANKFGAMLKARSFEPKSPRDPDRPRHEDKRIRTWVGLRIAPKQVGPTPNGTKITPVVGKPDSR